MAIDAVIESVRRQPDKTRLLLKPRRDRDGQLTIAGRRELFITKNPNYDPQVGDEIWGNTHQVVISKRGTDHKFRRIARYFDGTFEAR